MPPGRRAAAAPAAPPATPLTGCTIAFSGKFDSLGHNHTSLEALVRTLGGGVSRSVTKNTTHLVCTEEDFDGNTTKVAAAKAKDLKIVKPDWLLDSDTEKKKLDEEDFSWSAPPKTNGAAAKTKGAAKKTSAASKKRSADAATVAASDDEDDKPQAKKAKVTTTTTKAPAKGKTKAKSKTAAKADADDDAQPAEDVKEEKDVAEGQFIKRKDIAIPLDDYCPLTHFIVYIDPDSGMIYDASLNQSNSSANNNKFYRIQILFEPKTKMYRTWTRWGRVGEAGQNAILGSGTLPDAIKFFEKKFKDKSGLAWNKRGDDPRPGKYAFVERSYNPDDDDEDEEDAKAVKKEDDEEEEPPAECTLEKPVQELMELIFNQQYFQATMSALNYDADKLPLGRLSKATITRGFQQLKDLAALFDDHSLAQSKWDTSYGQAVEHLSNTYYSLIPHAFGRNRPPVISQDNMLKKEIELLESLVDMKDAADIMKIDRKKKDNNVHQLDRQFQGLGLEEMTVLDRKSKEFTHLETYLQESRGSTHHINYEVLEIFRIERQGEKQRFDSSPFATMKSDRRLLWHGSRCTNFGGILSQGLRIAPPEAPVSGYMFGKGIYLADMSSKSAGYCASGISNGHALLLLCEAELGDPIQKLTQANYNAGDDAKKNGMHSTWGQGNTGPSKWMDAKVVHPSLKGIKIPDTKVKPGPTNVPGASLYYNEFIAYDVAQVKLRYLFRVKM